jgi:glucose-1-phosphate adenylyltransferase
VILPDVQVNRHVKLRKVVVDKRCVLPEGLTVGFDPAADRKRFLVSERGITLITPEMLGQEIFHQR